jgi:beta-glucosidase
MIDFDWEDSGPYAALPENGFSVRWSGQLVPQVTGTYLIGLRSDDGSRMFVDGLMFIDHWDDHGPETATREMNMVAGRAYDICIEHYEKEGGAMMRLGWRAPDDDSLQRARKAARRADAAIIFAGLSSAVEGEGVDRETMDLPDEQEHLIHTVAAANSNTIVVLFGGTSVDMRRWIDGVPALLLAWYPGQAGGEALAEILFGEVNPSGKTPITVPRRIEDTPAFGDYPGFAGEVVYREGLYVGYRYYEKRDVQPMFPFGHGLSYTDFAYQDLHADPAEFTRDETVRVTVTVQNAGTVKGREVVQLYVSDPASSLDRPIKELKGFRDITLAPGESGQVTFELDRSAFSFYDPAQKAWIAEPGEFGIAVGRSSADIRLQGRCRLRAPDAE